MAADTPDDSNASEDSADLIEGSLLEARKESARFLNRVRFLLTSAFVGLYLIGWFALGMENFHETFWFMLLYWIGAGLLWHFSKKSDAILRASRVAIGVVDMPLVTLVQWINLPLSESPHATTLFTLSIYLFLTVMSAFTMRSHYLYLCAGVGIVCIWILESRAQAPVISYFSAPVMLIATAWMMGRLPRRQTALVREAAERKARRDRLARHFSPGVAELIESHDEPGEGEACELSVLFCDIRGFTQISESMDACEVVGLLNDFHGAMVDTIFRYGGTLDKYLGDGLLAYFNAPARQHDHAERATHCALEMLNELERFNDKRAKTGHEPIRVGIGVHAGQAVVGEIGAQHRREFTAIGDTVNVGSRLQGLTKNYDSDVLVSEPVVRQISEEAELAFEGVGKVAVRGRRQEIEVFVPIRGSDG